MKKRILEFDILRSLAVIWIIAVWHFSNYFSSLSSFGQIINNEVCKNITFVMLSLFMFLSGLFINLNKIVDKETVRRFYLKKIKRFYPLYIIAAIALYFTTVPSSISFYTEPSQLFLSLFGIATLFNKAPSTLWFMDMLLFFIVITPLFCCTKSKIFRILLMAVIYVLIYILSRKANIVDARYVRYVPFYMMGLLFTPDKFLEIANKFGLLAILLAVLLMSLLPVQHIFLDMCQFVFCIFGGGKLAILYCKSVHLLGLNKIIAFVSYSSMCAYFFHRQLYAIGVFLGLPILILPLVVFCLSYYVQILYDRIVK